MSDEEKYREIMQRLLITPQAEPTEDAWQSTHLYLEQQRKKKRRRLLFWIFSGILLTGSMGLLLLKDNAWQNKTSVVAESTAPALQSKSQSKTRGEKTKVIKAPTGISIKAKPEKAFKAKSPRNGKINIAPFTSKQNQEPASNTTQETKWQSPVTHTSAQASNPGILLQPGTVKTELTTPVPSGKSGNNEMPVVSEKLEDPELPLQLPPINAPETKTTAVISAQAAAPADSVSLTPQPVLTATDTLPAKRDSITSAQALQQSPGRDTILNLLPPPYLALEAGLGYFPDWNALSNTEAGFLQPVAALSVNKYISHKLLFSLGAGYTRLSDLQPTTITSSVTTFGYGEESAVVKVTPLRMHYVTVPVRLSWQLKSRHGLGLGVNFSYLFAVEAKVERYTTRLGSQYDQRSYLAGGYTEGFSLFNQQVALFYSYRLGRSFALQTEFNYGLRDLKENGFFNINRYERSTGIKLYLVYTLAHLAR